MKQLTSKGSLKKPQAHRETEQKSTEGAGSSVDPELLGASCCKYGAAHGVGRCSPAPYLLHLL